MYLLLFLVIPFIFLGAVGVQGAFKAGIFLVLTMIILAVGFFFGMGLAFLFGSPDYFTQYDMPKLWINQWIDSLGSDDGMWKYFLVPPYLLVADFFRIYLHFTLTNFSFSLIIPELVSWWTLSNYYSVFYGSQQGK